MQDSVWNHGASIPTSTLDEATLREAIHAWAEGCQELEDLLLLCHENGFETSACDAGNHGHAPYLDFAGYEGFQNFQPVLDAAWGYTGDLVFMLLFGGNPRSAPHWYWTTIDLSPRRTEAISFFKALNEALKEKKANPNVKSCKLLLEIAEFLTPKESGFRIVLDKDKKNGYYLEVSSFMNARNWPYYDSILEEAGFNPGKEDASGIPRKYWTFRTEKEQELEQFLERFLAVLKAKWSLELPTELTEDMSFCSQTMVMRRKYGSSEEGQRKLNEWIKLNFRKPFNELIDV